MPNYVDVVRLEVRAFQPPEIYAPASITLYEGQSLEINVSVVVGYPIITDFSHQLQSDAGLPVAEGQSNPSISYTELDWNTFPANAGGLQPVTIQAPTLDGDSPLYREWRVVFTVASSVGTRTATTRIFVYQSVPATIEIANYAVYELTNFYATLDYNAGSPLATTIRHKFYASAADAEADRNPITSGRGNPVSITPSDAQLAALSGQPIRERSGTLAYGPALPAVTAETIWYGRVEIIQNGRVADYDTYTLRILNSVAPSIEVTGFTGNVEKIRVVISTKTEVFPM
ncbi:hypothetical protein F4Z99_19980, partial [Candidatus Poribacteria bacterium]|nr:hypothetical protein [Candidatus Poribacteria bacterium]